MKHAKYTFFLLFFLFSTSSIYSLNVLIAVYQFPVLAQTFILNHITGLIDRGHSVTIYAQKTSSQKKHQAAIETYNLIEKTYYKELPEDLNSFDVILCEFGYVGTKFAKLKKEGVFSKPLITCFRGMDISACIASAHHKNRYTTLFEVGDLFLPVCNYFKDKLIQLGCDENKIIVHHSSIDCNLFTLSKRSFAKDGPIKIISVNRLVKKKGTEYAIKAVAQIIKKYKNKKFEYTIIGHGPDKAYLENLVHRLNIEQYVHFVGWKDRSEIIQELHAHDIFLLPSRKAHNGDEEGIPNALKEAMSCGLPVVSTLHAGIPELIQDGYSGYLVPEKQAFMLAEKLELLIKHPKRCKDFGKRGRKFVKQEHHSTTQLNRLETILFAVAESCGFQPVVESDKNHTQALAKADGAMA